MPDKFDKATRSRIMAAIKQKDTKPELALAAALSALGVAYERLPRGTLPGSPDFVVPSVRLAVFCHGCYWHLCRRHYKPPAGEVWLAKMDRNRRRDTRVRRHLRAMGWATLVVWEHEDAARGAARVKRRISRLERTHERAASVQPDVAGADARGGEPAAAAAGPAD
jgi:DNA mismatch endonuclease, patch repair protein